MSNDENALIKVGNATLATKPGWKISDNSDERITRMHIDFPNGYTASVVRGMGSYGFEQGLFEGAVMRGPFVVYDTPITDDTRGHMTAEEALEFIEQVAALPDSKAKV